MGRDTQGAIIGATLALIEEGDASFTYEQLAAKAGVARQTLYTHFPDRAELLVAAVDHVRTQLNADELVAPVFAAATARDALVALVDFHVAYTPQIMVPSRAIEAQRATSPALSEAFERRPAGRRQAVRHVVTRLRAEGDLRGDWSVDQATDLVSALMTAAFTMDLLDERGWSVTQLRERLHEVIERTLLIETVAAAPDPPATTTEGEPS